MKTFNHVNATTIDEAVTLLAKGNAMVNAGGTDLIGTLRFNALRANPSTIVNIKSIPGFDYIKEEDNILKIGATTRLEDIATNNLINSKYTALAQASGKTASPHIREMGTIGGNICQINRCWYFRKPDNRFDCIRKGGNMCYAMAGDNRYHSIFGAIGACVAVNPSDTAPALVALNANIVTNKRTIEAKEFWGVAIPGSTNLDEDEIVTEIQIPNPADGVKSAFVKLAIRKSIDFPIVNCAVAVGNGDARICLNAVYNIPYRATEAEDVIKGKTIDNSIAEEAADVALSGAAPLSKNKYKVQMAKAALKKALLACS